MSEEDMPIRPLAQSLDTVWLVFDGCRAVVLSTFKAARVVPPLGMKQ